MTNDELRKALQYGYERSLKCCIEDRCEDCILWGDIDCVGILKYVFEKGLEASLEERIGRC